MSSTDCAIEAHQLVKTYAVHGNKHGIRALDGLDLAVPRGIIYGLLGPNGAGKSTTVKILTSLARPDAGSARVAGIDVLAQPGRVRHVIGVVAQRSGADPTATGRENLMLQGRLYGLRGGSVRARADELLDHFGLTEAAGRLVKTYSGGMQRRLDVALGLMHRPASAGGQTVPNDPGLVRQHRRPGPSTSSRSREHAEPEVPPSRVAGFLLAGLDRRDP